MNFIQELVLEKIVPLGFSYDKVMLMVRQKMENEKWKTKRDVYQFLVSFLNLNRNSQAVCNFIFCYKDIFYDKHSKYQISYTKKDEEAFYNLIFWKYLIHGVEKQSIENRYQSYLALHYSNRKYLENKYAAYSSFLIRAISYLNWEEQLKLKQIYHFSTMASIENKILYYFRYFFLEQVLGVSFPFQKMGDICTGYLSYFEQVLKYKKRNINQYYQLLEQGNLQEKGVLDFFVERSFDLTIPVETYEHILSGVLEHHQLDSLQCVKKGLFLKFSDIPEQYVLETVEFLKKKYISFYDIIVKRHGESFEEWHSLSTEENALYFRALDKMKMYIKYTFYEKGVSSKKALEVRGYKSLFEILNMYDPKEVMRGLNVLKEDNIQYYEILYKRYGENLTEWHSLNNLDNAMYNNALNRLKIILKRRYCYREAKMLLIDHQDILPVIKLLRREFSIESVCEKFSYSVSELFDILKENLLLFDSKTVKRVLESFFLYQQQDKLLQSKQYWFLLQCYPNNFKWCKQDITSKFCQEEEYVTFDVESFALKKIPKEFLIHKNGS